MILRLSAATLLAALIGLLAFLLPASGWSDPRTFLEVSPNGRDDLDALMTTLEDYLDEGLPMTDPVVIILHGSEASSFTSQGYSRNRMLVDRAALLSAYRLIDVRMCETWMSENDVEAGDIPAFVETVPYAPEEIEKLEAQGYVPRADLKI